MKANAVRVLHKIMKEQKISRSELNANPDLFAELLDEVASEIDPAFVPKTADERYYCSDSYWWTPMDDRW